MKITRLLSISILLSVFFSCSHGFLKDPRLYNPKRTTVQTVAPEPELQLTGGVDPFDKIGEWYNNPDSNGDATNPETEGFAAEEFNQIQIAGWFSDKNVPTYTMTKGDVWKEGDATKREYVHSNAPSTEGQGWSITGVTYYQYRGINPNYEATGNYNTSLQMTAAEEPNPKLSRFYFYRFTGKGGGVQWLDNYLIAVDTYSKLIFAFSEPVEFSSMGAPTKWDPTDNEAFYGQMYQFYMYDPVGYVLKNDDGTYTVQLYQWFQDSLAAGNYKANINTAYTKIAEKRGKNDDGKDGAGKSPFNSHDVNFFEENMKLLGKAGVPFFRRESTPSGGNGLILYKYVVSTDGKTITRTAESWNGLSITGVDTIEYIISKKEAKEGDNRENGGSATKGIATFNGSTIDFEISDESRTIIFNNEEKASSNFLDPGPDFIERVKHDPVYKLGEDTYTFSENGMVLNMNGTPYYYCENRESDIDKSRAVYKKNDALFYGLELSEDDSTIEMTSWSGFYAIQWYTLGWTAYLDYKPGASFIDNLKGKTFTLRETDAEGAYTLNLHTYKFQNNSSTFITTDWHTGKESVATVSVFNGSDKLTGTINGQKATLSMPEDGNWTLTINGNTYYRNYKDPGPSFIYRVRNRWYQGKYLSYSPHNYVFSSDGKTMYYIYKGKTEAYSWTGKATDTTNTTFNEWRYSIDITDTEEGKAYKFDYAGVDYDATYRGTAEAAKNEGLLFP